MKTVTRMLDIHITTTLDKMLVKAIEHTIALAAIAKRTEFDPMTMIVLDWSVGHVSHYI